jgi:hypothetical protein
MSFWSDNPALQSPALTAVAGIVGIVVGAILRGIVDNFVQEKRLEFEQRNTIQQKLLEAQSALLDELGKVCWKYRYDAIKVVYHWLHKQPDKYEDAVKSYTDQVWTSLSDLRFLGTRAGRLFSVSAYEAIEEFYGRVDKIDSTIEKGIAIDPEVREPMFENVYLELKNDMRIRIANLILNLAKPVNLTPKGNHSSEIYNPLVAPLSNGEPSP